MDYWQSLGKGMCVCVFVDHDILSCRINDVQNVTVAMEMLVNYFDPTCKNVDIAAGEVALVTLFYYTLIFC